MLKYKRKQRKQIKQEKRRGRVSGEKRKSIAVHLILSFLIPVIFVIIVGFFSYRVASEIIVSNYKDSCLQSLEMTSKYLELGISSVQDEAVEYVNDDNFISYFSGKLDSQDYATAKLAAELKSSLVSRTMMNDFTENILVMSKKAGVLSTSYKWDNDLYVKFTDSENGEALNSSKSVSFWLGKDELIDTSCGIDLATYGVRYIKKFMGIDAAVMIDVSQSKIQELLSELSFDEGSRVAFVTKDGREIVQVIENETPQDIAIREYGFAQNVWDGEETSGSQNIRISGEKYLYLYSKVGETDSMLCVLIPEESILRQASRIKLITILLVLVASVIAIIIGIVISTGIQKAIGYIIKELRKVSSGDLTIALQVKRKDEFSLLASGINEMIGSMNRLICQIREESVAVAESSQNVSQSSDSFADATENIMQAIREIEVGVTKQAEDAEMCLKQMDQLARKVETVYGKTDEINGIAGKSSDCISNGMSVMEILDEKMKSTSTITEQIVTSIVSLQEKSQSISTITEKISAIAQRSNLLSLNASIEAARAGAAGRGFSVVAEEIRSLSQNSMSSANEIGELISDIQNTIDGIHTVSEQAMKIIEEQETAVTDTSHAFVEVNDLMQKFIASVDIIINNISSIEDAKNKTLESIENISAVSEQTASASVEVCATMDNQRITVEALNQMSENLDDNAKLLNTMIAQFIIE